MVFGLLIFFFVFWIAESGALLQVWKGETRKGMIENCAELGENI